MEKGCFYSYKCFLEKAGIKFLNENQKVSYEVNQTKGKLSAGNIKLLD